MGDTPKSFVTLEDASCWAAELAQLLARMPRETRDRVEKALQQNQYIWAVKIARDEMHLGGQSLDRLVAHMSAMLRLPYRCIGLAAGLALASSTRTATEASNACICKLSRAPKQLAGTADRREPVKGSRCIVRDIPHGRSCPVLG
jgi:hypothetical protein